MLSWLTLICIMVAIEILKDIIQYLNTILKDLEVSIFIFKDMLIGSI